MNPEPNVNSGALIAVLIPCYNEARTIDKVVRDFKEHLPASAIYVFDNGSTDGTAEVAKQAGAIVGYERRRGKGNVLRLMFRQIEADIYVMVDGDGTYPAGRVHDLIRPILEDNADMVVGSRLYRSARSKFKALNLIGNKFFLLLIRILFGVVITDLLSGYRAMNKQVAKNVPLFCRGFESETELTIKCLEQGYRVLEVPVDLSPRVGGSRSKINFIRDGILILETLFALARDYKPFTVFGFFGCLLVICGAILYNSASVVLAAPLILSGLLVGFTGLVLHAIARRFQDLSYQMRQLLEQQLHKTKKE